MPKRRVKQSVHEIGDEPSRLGDARFPNEREPAELRDQRAIEKALLRVYHLDRRLLEHLDPDSFRELTLEELRDGPLGRDLQHLAAYANGQVYEDSRLVLSAVEAVLQVLFWPAAAKDYTVPRSFWHTDLGRMLNRAQLRAYKPTDLVSIDDAARTCA